MDTEYFGLFITSTPPAPTLTGTELVPVIVSGTTNNTTTAAIAGLTASGIIGLPYTNTPISADFGPALMYTAGAQDELIEFTLYAYTLATDITAGTVTVTVSWTDPINGPVSSGGTLLLATPSENYLSPSTYLLLTAGSTITLSAAISGTYNSATYRIVGNIQRLNALQ